MPDRLAHFAVPTATSPAVDQVSSQEVALVPSPAGKARFARQESVKARSGLRLASPPRNSSPGLRAGRLYLPKDFAFESLVAARRCSVPLHLYRRKQR